MIDVKAEAEKIQMGWGVLNPVHNDYLELVERVRAEEEKTVKQLVFLLRLQKQIDDFECDHDAEHRCDCGNVHTNMILEYEKERDEFLATYRASKAKGEA